MNNDDNLITTADRHAKLRLEELHTQLLDEYPDLDDHQKIFILDEIVDILTEHPNITL